MHFQVFDLTDVGWRTHGHNSHGRPVIHQYGAYDNFAGVWQFFVVHVYGLDLVSRWHALWISDDEFYEDEWMHFNRLWLWSLRPGRSAICQVFLFGDTAFLVLFSDEHRKLIVLYQYADLETSRTTFCSQQKFEVMRCYSVTDRLDSSWRIQDAGFQCRSFVKASRPSAPTSASESQQLRCAGGVQLRSDNRVIQFDFNLPIAFGLKPVCPILAGPGGEKGRRDGGVLHGGYGVSAGPAT